MKLTEIVHKTPSIKKFTNYKNLGYKYKVVRIPALKDEINSRQQQGQSAPCVNEMSRMMDCWKRSDFSQGMCSQEIAVFMKCMATADAEAKENRERAAKGLPAKGSRMRPPKQVNEMLAKFPQPPTNFK